MDNKFLNKFSTFLFYISILIFIIAFNFSDNPTGGWIQQFMPNLNGRLISDVLFTDSLNGYATGYSNNDPNYILKSTDGGENWYIVDSLVSWLAKVQFLNDSIGYAGGARLFKTTNQGYNWVQVPMPVEVAAEGYFALNEDTILSCFHDNLAGGVFRTTNAGLTWTNTFYQFGQNPNKIYMFDKDIGFFTNGTNLRKTTNGGVNWFGLSGGTFTDIYFIDSLNGWKVKDETFIEKTDNGGNNWITYNLPPKSNYLILSRLTEISVLNEDTILGVGSELFFGNGNFRGIVYKSTDGGISWGYQLPDTSIFQPTRYQRIQFLNKNIGWCYSISSGIHTTTGGDTTILLKVGSNETTISINFILKQNYPNPFNPTTQIIYELKNSAYVKIDVYDVNGRLIRTLVNEKKSSGNYQLQFDGSGLSSGIFFYKLIVDERHIDTKKMILIR